MSLVGAKDITELDGKIEGLISKMKSSGGQLGTQLKDAQQREENHIKWIEDLQAGKPEARAYLEQIMGKGAPSQASDNNTQPNSDFDPEKYVDEDLATEVFSMKETIRKQNETITKLTDGEANKTAQFQKEEAVSGWIDDTVELVSGNMEEFGLNAKEVRALAKEYWGPDGHQKAIHPKFQKVHDLFVYAQKEGINDLNKAQKLINATKDGQKTTNYKESVNSSISNKQSRTKSNEPDPHLDEAAVQKMASGGDLANIPDSWSDADGNFIPEKVPKRFHVQAFGKVMG
jgi:hypothetical protein